MSLFLSNTWNGHFSIGALLGGGVGAFQAMKPNPALQGVGTTRLKVNQFLNQTGKQGRVAGNALGILGLFFSCSESGLGYLSDGQTPDWLNTLGAGIFTHSCVHCHLVLYGGCRPFSEGTISKVTILWDDLWIVCCSNLRCLNLMPFLFSDCRSRFVVSGWSRRFLARLLDRRTVSIHEGAPGSRSSWSLWPGMCRSVARCSWDNWRRTVGSCRVDFQACKSALRWQSCVAILHLKESTIRDSSAVNRQINGHSWSVNYVNSTS